MKTRISTPWRFLDGSNQVIKVAFHGLLLASALSCLALPARAAHRSWTDAENGYWSEPNSWSPAGVPTNGDMLTSLGMPPPPPEATFSVGINFAADEYPAGPNSGALASTDKAGVVPQRNWNNLTLNAGSAAALIADQAGSGTPTFVTVEWTSPNTWSSTIDLVISNIVHHFVPPDGFLPGYVHDELIYDKAGLTNVNLSDYESFELRFIAPSGKTIVVNRSGAFESLVDIDFIAGPDLTSHPTPATLSFENFSGAMPTRTYDYCAIADGGNALIFSEQETYTTAIKFTAMKYVVTPAHNPPKTAKTFESRSSSSIPVGFFYSTAAITPKTESDNHENDNIGRRR